MPNTQASAVPARQFVVSEPCGRDWREELLSFPVEWKPGEQSDASLVLTGPDGPLVTQLSGVEWHPAGGLARAVAWCRIDLKANQRLTLCLDHGNSPDHEDRPYFRPDSEGWTEAGNGQFAVRIPQNGRYAASQAPGPIAAVKIEGGEWIGQGRLIASRDIFMETVLVETGPLFVKWQTTARCDSEAFATTECVLYAGEPFVHIRETTSPSSDLTFAFNCFPGLRPDRLLTFGGGESIEQCVKPLDYARPEEVAVVDFNSGNHQMSLAWLGVYREGAEPFLGVMELNGDRWSHVSINRLHLQQNPPDALEIRSPLQGGLKEWALVCSTTALNLKAAGLRECNFLSRLHQRYTEVPLQKVKDWTLDWEEDTARPLLQCAPEDIERARERVQNDPELQRAYAAWPAISGIGDTLSSGSTAYGLSTLWVAFGEEAFARQAVAALEAEIKLHLDRFWAEGAYMRLIIFDGRSMKLWMQAYDVLKAGGFIEEAVDRRLRRDLAFFSYCFADPEYFPTRANYLDKNDPDSFFHGLGQRIGDAICPPNFHTEYYTTYGLMGCCFPGHPCAAHWRAESAELLELQLEKHFTDAGVYNESPNYHAHVLTMISQLALALRRNGGPDFFAHPRFKAQFDYFCQMQTPPVLMNEAAQELVQPALMLDADHDRFAMLPGNGNSGYECADMPLPVEMAIGAAIYRESDPALSARCMTTWRNGGRRILNHLNHLTFLLVADPHLPNVGTIGLQSSLLTGAYATFRGNAETEDEVFVLIKNGTATHHNDFDEGGFTIWAYGAPVASDFGYHAAHAGKHFGVGDTWKHNCVEFDGKSSGYLGIEQSSPPEKWVSTPLADLLVSHIPITNFRDLDHMTYMDQIPAVPIEYRRYTLFVKPHYLLILDSILECAYSHRWWLHAQAEEVTTNGPRAHFKGKFGVDLMAHFIAPEAVELSAGEWGPMRHISAEQTGPRDWRVFVAPLKPGQDFAVSAEGGGRVVHVQAKDYRDTVLLSHYPFDFQGGGVHFRGRAGVVREFTDGRPVETVLLDGERIETTGK